MLIPLNEPIIFRYIYINPATNRVHLLVPFIAGIDVSTDNTCKSDVELTAFFEGGAFKELASYKSTLEFHLTLLKKDDALYSVKKGRLDQINLYLETIDRMRNSYKTVVNSFLSKSSNLYSIQLRPRTQDPMSSVVNPVFTIKRRNDSRGTPLSPLYNKMHEVYPGVVLGKANPREELIQKVLDALPSNASFETIQDVLATTYGVPDDFFKKRTDANHQEQEVDRLFVDGLMGFDENTTSREYVEALIGLCAPNLESTLQGSPFYFDSSSNISVKAERLSILTQFYLGVLNVYCCAKGISVKNFGEILDNSPHLSKALVNLVAETLGRGGNVEHAIIDFCNAHQSKDEFDLSRSLSTDGPENDKDTIVQKFETTYRTVTATKENPHMDDFMFLDPEAQGNHAIFISHKGLICTDAANIIPSTPQNQDYLAEIRDETRIRPIIISPQDEPVIKIDIAPIELIDKLSDEQWERLPSEVVETCRAHPSFKVRELLDLVAKGKQDEAHAILEASEDKQILLRTSSIFTDYSGRTFHCTAYEYAYWAKDKHMMDMLTSHMDAETKAFMSERVDMLENSGLAYQQHGASFQNAHYDMSFILKKLSTDEFRQLQTMVGQSNPKIQQANMNNYQNISFTATEYESLKKSLKKHRPMGIFSFFKSSPATALSKKLQFDFHSLISALEAYVTNYAKWNYHEQVEGWMKVGKAQRDVPAHIAHEYCRPDRAFDPIPSFNEETLPRVLTFNNYTRSADKSWFPLPSSSSGLGFNFALMRGNNDNSSGMVIIRNSGRSTPRSVTCDLAAARRLDEVRNDDFKLSREMLKQTEKQQGLMH